MEKNLMADGLTVRLTRKPIKNAYLRVCAPGVVSVSAPARMSDASVLAFVRARRAWIDRHMPLEAPAPHTYAGGTLPLWGAQLPLVLMHTGKPGMRVQDGTLLLHAPEDAGIEERASIAEKFYRGELAAALPDAIMRAERIAGVSAAEWRVRSMSTRWGSCNVEKKRIWLSLRLAEKPPECLDYVLLHELCHLYERGHGPAFWARMDVFCPDWRRIRRRLSEGERPCT